MTTAIAALALALGYRGVDASKVGYYFGNLDERRVAWSAPAHLPGARALARGRRA